MRHRINWYKPGKTIHVHDKMQPDYTYTLSKPYGNMDDHPEFKPFFTPQEMLSLGIFEGKYINDAIHEFPKEWYDSAISNGSLSLNGEPNINCNYFKIKSRQSLAEWRKKQWIIDPDVRGWFQWYCRFFLGRRIPIVDEKQIARWKAFNRHRGSLQKHCQPHNNLSCRPKQRQALLQWSHNPF